MVLLQLVDSPLSSFLLDAEHRNRQVCACNSSFLPSSLGLLAQVCWKTGSSMHVKIIQNLAAVEFSLPSKMSKLTSPALKSSTALVKGLEVKGSDHHVVYVRKLSRAAVFCLVILFMIEKIFCIFFACWTGLRYSILVKFGSYRLASSLLLDTIKVGTWIGLKENELDFSLFFCYRPCLILVMCWSPLL